MGGRGSSSGKKSSSSGVGGSDTKKSSKGAAIGGGASTVPTRVGSASKVFTPSKTPVSKMSDKKLRDELVKAAGHWYASGKSGISFGGKDPHLAAASLINPKMSRASMERQYKKIIKKLG